MPRLARKDLLYDGCYCHIISRSIRKMKLFKDREDFQLLAKLLLMTKQKAAYQIFHYCFMHTHFHFCARLKVVEAFSKAIQYVKSQYCQHYHTKYRLSGPIWRERFRSLIIEDERYLRVCGQYVEHNPIRAGLVKEANQWEFSSFKHHNQGSEDLLIDAYDFDDNISKSIELDCELEEFFENGKAIGSPFFRFQFHEKLKRS